MNTAAVDSQKAKYGQYSVFPVSYDGDDVS